MLCILSFYIQLFLIFGAVLGIGALLFSLYEYLNEKIDKKDKREKEYESVKKSALMMTGIITLIEDKLSEEEKK